MNSSRASLFSVSRPVIAVLGFALSVNVAIAQAAAASTAPTTPVTLNFVDADIDVVAKAVGELTGKTFVLDPRQRQNQHSVRQRHFARLGVPNLFVSFTHGGIRGSGRPRRRGSCGA